MKDVYEIGDMVEFNSEIWKIIGVDIHSKQLRKEWDYLIENTNTKSITKVWARQIRKADVNEV